MNAIFVDCYRNEKSIILWLKIKEGGNRYNNICFEVPFVAHFYIAGDDSILKKLHLGYISKTKKDFLGTEKQVFRVEVKNLFLFERIISNIEKTTKFAAELYGADISPEMQFLCEYDLNPFSEIRIDSDSEFRITSLKREILAPLTQATIDIQTDSEKSYDEEAIIRAIKFNNEIFIVDDKEYSSDYVSALSSEKKMLKDFVSSFNEIDPDILLMRNAFAAISQISCRLQIHNLEVPFHRWHNKEIRYKGGRSFYSYGQVKYRDFGIRLHGRLLIDLHSTIGSECDIDALTELAHLSGSPLQLIASRSYGTVFQNAIIRLLHKEDILIPFKHKPLDSPINLDDLLKSDRAGLTLNTRPGIHEDVVEIDFTSMFPFIICNYNISAETMLSKQEPLIKVPDTNLSISYAKEGYTPRALRPILERRMYYKKNPSLINKRRAVGLKMILVSSYGYLRFREFKLGLASCHMAICAYAREIILKTMEIARSRGFVPIHGIIDSLYLKKKDMRKEEVEDLCKEIEDVFNIPLAIEGYFKWIVLLPSVNDENKPVPTRYYGVHKDGGYKARGIEVRKKDTPDYIRDAQETLISFLSDADDVEQLFEKADSAKLLLRDFHKKLDQTDFESLISQITLSKDSYRHDNIQNKIANKLRKKDIPVMPGKKVRYIRTNQGPLILNDDDSKSFLSNKSIDKKHYQKKLINSFYSVLQPFGITKKELENIANDQRSLKEFFFQLT